MVLQSAVSLAHHLWPSIIEMGSYVIDATCGNGYDTLFLSKLTVDDSKGKVIAIDVQQKALDETRQRLKEALPSEKLKRISLVKACHSEIDMHCEKEADLIVYNLGYLPGSDKSITTTSISTLISLKKSLELLKVGGYLSITCYPGHTQGQTEAYEVLDWAKNLDSNYDCSEHRWTSRSEKSPFLIMILKRA